MTAFCRNLLRGLVTNRRLFVKIAMREDLLRIRELFSTTTGMRRVVLRQNTSSFLLSALTQATTSPLNVPGKFEVTYCKLHAQVFEENVTSCMWYVSCQVLT